MEIPTRLIKFLIESKVSYEILHHPEAFTAQTIAQAEHIIKGRHHAKVVMVKSGGEHLISLSLPIVRLMGMRERVAVFGGAIELAGVPGQGTAVVVGMPIFKN